MAKDLDRTIATPVERMLRATVETGNRAVATRQLKQEEAALGALYAAFALGQGTGMSEGATIGWLRKCLDIMAKDLEEQKRFPPL